MVSQPSVILISRDAGIQRLLKQILNSRHTALHTVTWVETAESIIVQQGVSGVELVVIDIPALAEDGRGQQAMACRLLRDWTNAWPTLPLLFVGTSLQRHTLHAIRADTVGFVLLPVAASALSRAVNGLARHHSPASKPGVTIAPTASGVEAREQMLSPR